jgi:hypothetical protein
MVWPSPRVPPAAVGSVTRIAESMSAKRLVAHLDQAFSEFDAILVRREALPREGVVEQEADPREDGPAIELRGRALPTP